MNAAATPRMIDKIVTTLGCTFKRLKNNAQA